jgi:hypothetical protein
MKKKLLKTMGLVLTAVLGISLYFNSVDTGSKTTISVENEFPKIIEQKTQKNSKKIRSVKFSPDRPDAYGKLHRQLRTIRGQEESGYSKVQVREELSKAQKKSKFKSSSTDVYESHGPGNVGGRTRALIIDSRDASLNTWFAGSVGGGIWKTDDSGQHWVEKTAGLTNITVSDINQSKSNPQIFYAGTGESFAGYGLEGDGILKSTNGGENWTILPSTLDTSIFKYVNRLVVSDADPNIVVVATNSGIYKTTNGGTTWVGKFTGRFTDLKSKADDFSILFAPSPNYGIYKSTNAGETWSLSSGTLLTSGRIEIAVSEKNTNIIYAAMDDGSSSLFKSADAGQTWYKTVEPNYDTNIWTDQWGREYNWSNWLQTQGSYDNTLGVNPYDENKLMVGGVNLSNVTVSNEIDTAITKRTFFEGGWATGANSTGNLWGGGAYTASAWNSNYVDQPEIYVEVVFDSNNTQFAHRFVANATTFLYEYQGYVDVPFQVWDRTNNRQLMASFRDNNGNNDWDLLTAGSNAREYLFIHNIDYSTTANTTVSTAPAGPWYDGPHVYKLQYEAWMVSTGGIDRHNMPLASLHFQQPEKNPVFFRTDTKVSHWHEGTPYPFVHADQHKILFAKKSEAAKSYLTLVGNDGGIWASVDGGKTWKDRSLGYVTSQFYGADMSPAQDDGHGGEEFSFVGGMQDNGSKFSNFGPDALSKWNFATGGDGFEVAWHQSDVNKLATTLYDGRIYVSENGGEDFTQVLNLDQSSIFVTPVATSAADPNMLATVGNDEVVHLSRDFGKTWQTSSLKYANIDASNRPQIKIHDANPNIIWSGAWVRGNGATWGRVSYTTNAGRTWEASSGIDFNGTPAGEWVHMTDLATHPSKDSTVFVSSGVKGYAKIMRSEDMGQTWEDLSGFSLNEDRGFPDVAVYAVLAVERESTATKAVTEEIWAGTEIGIFVSKDDGASWNLNTDFPAVGTWDLKRRGKYVVIATHGRGVWSAEISDMKAAPTPTLIPEFTVTPSFAGQVKVDYNFRSVYDSAKVILTNLDSNSSFIDTTLVLVTDTGNYASSFTYDYSEKDSLNDGFNAKIRVAGYKSGVEYRLPDFQAFLAPKEVGIASYGTDFEGAHDLSGTGYSVQLAGFNSKVMSNTTHPYVNNSTIYLTLDKVIHVDSVGTMTFDEVAIVEPGEADGSALYDYVVVEGSPDGSNWTELTTRYDADAYPSWRSIYDATGAPAQKDMKSRTINLLSKFAEGTDIKIRFKLFADGGANGWGWAIDNLYIQETAPVFVEAEGSEPMFDPTFIQHPVFKRNAYLSVSSNVALFGDALNGNYYHATNGTPKNLNFIKTDSLEWFEKGIALATGNNSDLVVALTGFGIKASGASNDTAFHDTLSIQLVFTSSKTKNSIADIEFDVAAKEKSSLPIAKVHGQYENEVSGMTRINTAIVGYKAVKNDKDFSIKFNMNSNLVEGSQVYRRSANGWTSVESDKFSGFVKVTAKEFGTYAVFVDNKILEHAKTVPTEFSLAQNFPNPFNPVTTIPFKLKENTKVSLVIYNALGQKIKTLVSGTLSAGVYNKTWNGSNDLGRKVASGIYFYKLVTPSKVFTKKMVLIK